RPRLALIIRVIDRVRPWVADGVDDVRGEHGRVRGNSDRILRRPDLDPLEPVAEIKPAEDSAVSYIHRVERRRDRPGLLPPRFLLFDDDVAALAHIVEAVEAQRIGV